MLLSNVLIGKIILKNNNNKTNKQTNKQKQTMKRIEKCLSVLQGFCFKMNIM